MVINTVKAIMGAGCFALPWAFTRGGLGFTSACMVGAGALSLYTLKAMLRAKYAAAEAGAGEAGLATYSNIAAASMGSVGGTVCDAMICVTCFGICSAYIVFMATTLATVLQPSIPAATQNALVGALAPPMVLLSWIRDLNRLSFTSLLGNVSVAVGMSFVMFVALSQPTFAAVPLSVPSSFTSIFGSVAFLFFIHFTLPEIEHNMAEKPKFVGAVLKAFLITGTFSAVFGAVGAVGFGPGVSSVVVAMLEGSIAAVVVKLLLVFNLAFTFPVVCRAAFLVLESYFPSVSATGFRVLRMGFVLFAAYCGVAVPSFGRLVGLVGGVCCTALTITLPPLMLLKASADAKGRGQPALVGAPEAAALWAVCLVGLGIMALTVLA